MLEQTTDELPPRYHLSGARGRLPGAVFILAILSGVVIGFLIGAISLSVESGKLHIAAPVFFGIGIGYGCFFLSKQLKSRNPLMIQATSLLGGFAAAYGSFIAVLSSVNEMGTIPITPIPAADLLNPVLFINTFTPAFKFGAISQGRVSVPLSQLEPMCVLQAGILLLSPVLCARVLILRQVFCEDCQKWLDIGRKRLLFPVPEREELKRLRAGDLTALLEQELHRPIHASKPPYIRLDYVLCNTCGNTGVFRVMTVTPRPTGLFSHWRTDVSWSDMWGENDGKTVQETALTPLLQLTPGAAHQLGLLQARDRETKAPAAKPAAIKPGVRKPVKPIRLKKRGEK